MRKLNYYFLTAALFLVTNAFSQYATSEGDSFFDFGVGVGRAHGLSYYSYSYNYNNGFNNGYRGGYGNNIKVPTATIVYQKAFWDDITIGGILGFNVYGYSWDNSGVNYSESSKANEWSSFIGARGEYHFNRLIDLDSQFDLYAGVMAGMRIWGYKGVHEGSNSGGSWREEFNDSGADPVGGAFGGFRYYFGRNIAVYGEVGWAITNFRAGLCWKL